MKAWGILGEPTKEQIQEWMNMPYGSFKSMVADLKRNRKKISRYTVEVKKITSEYHLAYVDVQSYNHNQAIELAKKQKDLDWFDPKKDADKYEYRVSQIWD